MAGIAGNGQSECFCSRVFQKLANFFRLAICQSVHGVDDDCSRSGRGVFLFFSKDVVNNREKEGERFTGTGAGGHNIAALEASLSGRFHLVLKKLNGLKRQGWLADFEKGLTAPV